MNFDRINARRTILYIEGELQNTLLEYMFEPNDAATRKSIVDKLQVRLHHLINDNTLSYYSVICDERNNSSETTDNNMLQVNVLIQPTESIEYIALSCVLAPDGTFVEIEDVDDHAAFLHAMKVVGQNY